MYSCANRKQCESPRQLLRTLFTATSRSSGTLPITVSENLEGLPSDADLRNQKIILQRIGFFRPLLFPFLSFAGEEEACEKIS